MLRLSAAWSVCFAIFLILAAGCQKPAPPGPVAGNSRSETVSDNQTETTDDTETTPQKEAINDTNVQPVTAVEPSATAPTSSSEWATLKGQFIYDGPAPEPKFLTPVRNTPFCSKHKIPDESLVVNQENNGIVDIVIFLRKKPSRISPAYDKDLDKEVVLNNLNCRFDPHVQFVRTGQKLIIGNKDNEGHNTNISVSNLGNRSFNEIIPAMGQLEKTFDKPERRQVDVKCNIHPWMSGVLVIKDHPYMTKTDKDGKFEIKDLPTGEELEFQFWQGKYIRNVKDANAEFSKKGRVKLTLDGDFDLGIVKVDPVNFEN